MPSWSLPSASQPKVVVTQLAQSKVIAQLSLVLPNVVLPFHTQVVDSPHQPACAMLPTQLEPLHTMVRPLQSSAIMLCMPKYQQSLLVSLVLLSTCEFYENKTYLCLEISLLKNQIKTTLIHCQVSKRSYQYLLTHPSLYLLLFIYIVIASIVLSY